MPETPHLLPLKGPQRLPDSHIPPIPSSFREFQSPQEITSKEKAYYKTLFRSITNLTKQYSDADHYGGASHKNFDDLVLTFTTHRRSSGILNTKDLPEVFHIILKGMALAYFLRNYKGKGLVIKAIYTIMRSRFHTYKHTMALKHQIGFLNVPGVY